MDAPTARSQGPAPDSGKGGHFEPSAHGAETRVRWSDSEYKIPSDLADQLIAGGTERANGRVRLYTERAACDSCARIIEQFEAKFPGIKVEVFNDFTVDGAPL